MVGPEKGWRLRLKLRKGPWSTLNRVLGVRSIAHQFDLDLEPLKLAHGTTLTYRVRAADQREVPGPNEVWSEPRVLLIDRSASPQGSDIVAERQKQLREIAESTREDILQLEPTKPDSFFRRVFHSLIAPPGRTSPADRPRRRRPNVAMNALPTSSEPSRAPARSGALPLRAGDAKTHVLFRARFFDPGVLPSSGSEVRVLPRGALWSPRAPRSDLTECP